MPGKIPRRLPVLFATLALGAAVATAAGGAQYPVATHHTANIITSGSVAITLLDQTEVAGDWVDWPAAGIANVLPGVSTPKRVRLQNTGNSPVWVRLRVQASLTLPGGTAPAAVTYQYTDAAGYTRPGYNTDAWQYDAQTDTYLHKTALQPGTATAPLFTAVVLDGENAGDHTQNAVLNIEVVAQAVQSANNAASAAAAVGWPSF